MRIVTDITAEPGRRRFFARARRIRGLFLIMIGISLVPLGVVFLLASISDILFPDDQYEPLVVGDITTEPFGWWELFIGAVCVILGLALVRVGIALVRGRRHLVIFLRRFGFNDASKAISEAVGAALGREWRLVTLDDSAIAPLGSDKRTRRATILTSVCLVLVIAAIVRWFATGGPDSLLPQDSLDSELASIVVPLLAVFGGVVVAVGVVLALAAMLASRRAERRKVVEIKVDEDVAAIASEVDRRSRRVFSARLTVVRVTDELWRQAVSAFGAAADVALIDVSDPTDHLVWEVATMSDLPAIRIIFIGAHDAVIRLAAASSGPAKTVRRALDDKEVLTYQPDNGKAFERNLRGLLAMPAEVMLDRAFVAARHPRH